MTYFSDFIKPSLLRYKPVTYSAHVVVLPQGDFDALQRRLAEPGRYDPRVAKVLSTPAPWDEPCDKTSTSSDQ